jgi:hypothetical protein
MTGCVRGAVPLSSTIGEAVWQSAAAAAWSVPCRRWPSLLFVQAIPLQLKKVEQASQDKEASAYRHLFAAPTTAFSPLTAACRVQEPCSAQRQNEANQGSEESEAHFRMTVCPFSFPPAGRALHTHTHAQHNRAQTRDAPSLCRRQASTCGEKTQREGDS